MSGGTIFDDPNREAVGLDPAWVEGTGGSGGTATPTSRSGTADLDEMTKEELLAHAQEIGAKPANASLTKDELRASIDAKLAGG